MLALGSSVWVVVLHESQRAGLALRTSCEEQLLPALHFISHSFDNALAHHPPSIALSHTIGGALKVAVFSVSGCCNKTALHSDHASQCGGSDINTTRGHV